MKTPSEGTARYEIRLAGRLNETWSEWFEGLDFSHTGEDETRLSGRLPDQAALLGILNKLHSLNLRILSIALLEADHPFPVNPCWSQKVFNGQE